MKKPFAPDRPAYTPDQKVAAVRRLHDNGGNLKGTARELQIPTTTLYGWNKKIGGLVDAGAPDQAIIESSGLRASRVSAAMLERNAPRASLLLGEAIAKARELVRDETDLGKLNGTLRVLCDLIVRLGQQADDANTTIAEGVSLFQQAVKAVNIQQIKTSAEDAEEDD